MARINTRMQKAINRNTNGSLAPGSDNITSFQLEGGEEECQIKRIVLSGASEHVMLVQLALNDEAFTAVGQFTDERVIYSFVCTGPQLLNETTTIRVVRGDHLGIRIAASSDNPGATAVWAESQLNYLVLS